MTADEMKADKRKDILTLRNSAAMIQARVRERMAALAKRTGLTSSLVHAKALMMGLDVIEQDAGVMIRPSFRPVPRPDMPPGSMYAVSGSRSGLAAFAADGSLVLMLGGEEYLTLEPIKEAPCTAPGVFPVDGWIEAH